MDNTQNLEADAVAEIRNKLSLAAEEALSYSYDEEELPTNRVVSLFTGAGGLDLGVQLAGIQSAKGEKAAASAFKSKNDFNRNREESSFTTIYTNDTFPESCLTYAQNLAEPATHQHQEDIRRVKNFPKSELLIGGFPCPGFSLGGLRLIDDKRNFLYLHFIRALKQSQPKFFIAENVKGILTLGKGEVIKQIVEDFASAGYEITYFLVNAADYGVPQLRERVFIIGKHKKKVGDSFEYKIPEPTHAPVKKNGLLAYTTLKEAIGDLESDPGAVYTGGYSSMYQSRNRKKTWEQPSFTIQASARQAPQHPGGEPMRKLGKDQWEFQGENNRRLSTKEIARIQTFPDWFVFNDGGENSTATPNTKADKIYKQVGNAVPVLLAKTVAQQITDYLVENPE